VPAKASVSATWTPEAPLLLARPLPIALALLSIGGCAHKRTEATAPVAPATAQTPTTDAESDAEAPPSAPWHEGAVFYEIFVRSFADSDGDGVGDFAGLTARLDELNDGDDATDTDLGVDALWLMPVFESPSYHGYDVTNYRATEPDYGSLEDFDALVAAAHARGIRVILDFVLNHSSSAHPWFLSSAAGAESPHRDYYLWREEPDGRWRRPWDESTVWHVRGDDHFMGLFYSGMPDLNLENHVVVEEMIGAMRFWLDRGVDGFRVDAARYLVEREDESGVQMADTPQTHALVRRIRAALDESHPGAVLVAEAWTDTARIAPYYGDGDEFHLAFSFDVAGALLESVRSGQRADLVQALRTAGESFTHRAFEAPFLTNHDMRRAARVLDGDDDGARLAAATLLALPGSPFLYYGEEIGMRGGEGDGDEHKRTPMRWSEEAPGFGFTTSDAPWFSADEPAGTSVDTQRRDPDSLWRWYQRLIAQRRGQAALRSGELEVLRTEGGGPGALALLRRAGEERVLFVANFDRAPAASLKVDLEGDAELLLQRGADSVTAKRGDGLVVDGLGPRSFAFFFVR
jgi:glycosidase